MAKIFANDDYVFEVAGLVPKLQATGQVTLLQELQGEYFSDKDIKDIPEYVEKVVDVSNAAFTEMQKRPVQQEMDVEEIKHYRCRSAKNQVGINIPALDVICGGM